MMYRNFNVTVYGTYRVSIKGVEAESHAAAAERAESALSDYGRIVDDKLTWSLGSEPLGETGNGVIDIIEPDENTTGFLVDVAGDDQYLESQALGPDYGAYIEPASAVNLVRKLASLDLERPDPNELLRLQLVAQGLLTESPLTPDQIDARVREIRGQRIVSDVTGDATEGVQATRLKPRTI